ncbi:trypsin family protein [Candidatus Phytoplasma oryzae]|uniref:Trypsin family protein n=1 Tax=Candidatus Phytoplasma oryzae TaxID=203274 RepID=A0A139JQL4_9MOLU|nr:serine protease [Candidatus Phytoplasma oryzae]KXT29265.1 trypsin family protein [Candidatus Phytoplasma oryzae]RAM57849.1 hypothetical protein DH96_00790 [Candidatus Phytoplasma oryzae]
MKEFLYSEKKQQKKKYFFLFFFLFIILLFLYYKFFVYDILKKQEMDVIKNHLISHLSNKDTNSEYVKINKNKKIKENQEKIKTFFDQKIISKEEKNNNSFELQKYSFEQGDYVYAFVLDTQTNDKPFQEGIVSQNYSEEGISFLPISIKGKNNKIFFNKNGEFIGITLPVDDTRMAINFIITSNFIFHLMNCLINHGDQKNLFEINENIKKETKYFINLCLKQQNQNHPVEICLNENGFFIGLKWGNKFLDIQKLFKEYNICAQCCYKKLSNLKNILIPQNKPKLSNNKKIDDQIYDETNDELLKKKINELSFITLTIRMDNALGSGFIFKTEEINSDQKYKYYVLTNRHVITSDIQNQSTVIYNRYFLPKRATSISFIENKRSYDDMAVLTFEEDINKFNAARFQKINKILEYALPKQKIEIHEGEEVYSMGSQMSQTPIIHYLLPKQKFTLFSQITEEDNQPIEEKNFFPLVNQLNYLNEDKSQINAKIETNLLKKGNIIYFHEKLITFNISIDFGNSGGPVFNKKGQIIGLNRSTAASKDLIDEFTKCINIEHVKENLMVEHWEKDNFFKKENINFLLNKISNFNNFIHQNDINNIENKKITFFISELLSLYVKKKQLIGPNIKIDDLDLKNPLLIFNSDPLITKKKYETKIIINFFQHEKIDNKEQIFSFDPTEEKLKIELFMALKDNQLNFVTRFIKQNKENKIFIKDLHFDLKEMLFNNLDTQNFDQEHEGLDYFLSMKLIHLSPRNNISNEEKIKKSLIIWRTENNIQGNGIILNKKKLENGNFLYFILSNHNGNVNIIDELKNIFLDKAEIITYKSDFCEKEKMKIKSFYSNKVNNFVLITFESNYNYNVAQISPFSKISLGEEIYFLFNLDNEKYSPQIFKSNIGTIEEKKKSFLFDSIFNLKNKKEKNYQFNFLCFDKEGNFIGFNNIIKYYNNPDIPSYFLKGSFLQKEDLLKLFVKSKIKDNWNVILTIFFILTSFYIFLKITFISTENDIISKIKKSNKFSSLKK